MMIRSLGDRERARGQAEDVAHRAPRRVDRNALLLISLIAILLASNPARAAERFDEGAYATQIQPLIRQYCLACHSTEKQKGSLDLERFSSLALVRKEVKPWQMLIEQLESGEMPPKTKAQPTEAERARLVSWVRGFLDHEAMARAGDPGDVPLRRLSNAEYNAIIRDLTGVDLHPARQFPADGAAGEGFTNAAEALAEMSPTLLNKYLLAAKEIASHAVFLPDGFRFSAGSTRRDWSDESLAQLRKFYARFTADGKLPLKPYLAATLRHREALQTGAIQLEEVAVREKLNAKFLQHLWKTMTGEGKSSPLNEIQTAWRQAAEKDAERLATNISAWQGRAWKIMPIGSYRYGNVVRQHPADPAAAKPAPGTSKPAAGTNLPAPSDPAGLEEFRQAFPLFICYPAVIPVDEVVCLKMYHREDEPLIRLFLDDADRALLEHLWAEHRFITQQPVAENRYLPLFIGFVTQDQPKELVAYFESQREPFRQRAEAFEKEMQAAIPKQLEKLAEFAAPAYRRPISEAEKAELVALHGTLKAKGMSGEDALRGVLSRILVAPSFLLRIEQPPEGKDAAAINDWELATRLSLFLWSSVPDEALRKLATAGKLHDPDVLAQQAGRMLKDERIRSLAIELGTQWIHVRGFDEFKDKSETLYPSFDAKLRTAMYEESILFFQDLFQQDRPAQRILDADYTYLNDTLAKHYGIPGVAGAQWRRVEGVRKFGRGGILGLASVQAKQAGAARTSPVLRGNWVVETLLGEKLPRPPADVPKLPEAEGATDGLTMRQLVENHTRIESCAVCHQRIDPLGFAFERYDAIGRWREKESTGLAVDCRAKMKDGIEFEGIDGLRNYLLTKKKDVIIKLFCRKLLGYALSRGVTLSDQSLIEAMVTALNKNNGKLSAAVLEIVRSPQFRKIRGRAFVEGE